MTIYLEHFGLNEAPFKITPHTEFFFAGANRGETLEALIYAITSGEGMVKVTGEVGAGKTMLCRVLMERLPDSVETIYLAVPSLAPDEMLATIADDLGVDVHGGNTTKLIRALQERLIATHAQGKQVVALIDEAHAMPLETLEEIRLLSNLETSHDKLMQIVLFGQPELDQHLMLPNMRQLKERITHSFNLLPLPARDIKDYLNFRLRAAGYKGPDLFSPDALKLIAEASEGSRAESISMRTKLCWPPMQPIRIPSPLIMCEPLSATPRLCCQAQKMTAAVGLPLPRHFWWVARLVSWRAG